jgi:hypothetical protein
MDSEDICPAAVSGDTTAYFSTQLGFLFKTETQAKYTEVNKSLCP